MKQNKLQNYTFTCLVTDHAMAGVCVTSITVAALIKPH